MYPIRPIAKVKENEPIPNKSCCMLANSLSGGTIRILINNHKPNIKLKSGNILKTPLESERDSNNSFPPPGSDLNKTPSKHIK